MPNAAEPLVLILPLPPRALSPNAHGVGGHWSQKSKPAREYRARAAAEARKIPASLRPHFERAETQATFYFPTVRTRDLDNAAASLKAAWDGLADAGVIVNDAGLVHLPPVLELDRVNPRVVLVLWPLPALAPPSEPAARPSAGAPSASRRRPA